MIKHDVNKDVINNTVNLQTTATKPVRMEDFIKRVNK